MSVASRTLAVILGLFVGVFVWCSVDGRVVSAQPAQPIARLFAVTDSAPYLSYSWGEHWQILRGGRSLRGFSGTIRDVLCVGPKVFAGGTDGLFESYDFGETFRPVPKWEFGEIRILHAARMFILEPTLLVGTKRGLYRSDDGGEKWRLLSDAVGQVHAIEWPGPEMFVAGSEGLFVTVDKGDSFKRLTGGAAALPDAPILSLSVSRFFALDPVLFVGFAGKGIYRSDDGGESFKPVGEPKHRELQAFVLRWWDKHLFVGTEKGLLVSEDQGEHFSKVPIDLREVHAISIPAAGSGYPSDIIVGGDKGVYKSSDGGQSYRQVIEGLGERAVRRFATFPFPDAPSKR